ncbi:glycosyltransferase [Pseudoalteromonas sp. C2R02]|uniref:glycosyltransferase n=1 Tax=Pseudoalteromonas sp. C2R02 TaxID=2841565 RepID=UPI001C0A0957|nr:glycosyltransferase [Pseudoalteromonas sp. C2R02]MBU2971738.1 glycosyltransferase [Pseudoalteromonas sp. C2R02]
MNLTVYYDFLMVNGGAEKVFFESLELSNSTKGVVDHCNLELTEELSNNISLISKKSPPRMFAHFLTPWRFYHYKKDNAPKTTGDIVNLYSGLYSLLAIKHLKADKNIYYCHTPPRHFYDLADYYKSNSSKVQRCGMALQKFFYLKLYEKSIKKMDVVIANSVNVQKRLKQYLNIDSIVVYPPCAVDEYYFNENEGYYLSTARLENYKRIDLIIDAFIKMPDKKLKITSGGSLASSLKLKVQKSKAKNIEFTGWLNENQIKELVSKCIATIYIPYNEDFGMSPVESMAAGKPVIGVNEGGIKETIIDGVTGFLCPENPTVKDVIEKVNILNDNMCLSMKMQCILRAKKFSTSEFKKNISVIL